jgi:hypothetical protein
MRHVRLKQVFLSLALGAGFISSMGASCATPECDTCVAGGELYACHNTPGQGDVYECQPNQAYADLWCYNLGGLNPTIVDCGTAGDGETGTGESTGTETGDSAGAESWDPSVSVAHNPRTGVYEIEADFVRRLKAEAFAPLQHDSARFVTLKTGYVQLVNVSSTDLAAALGLESGDILIAVNGLMLSSGEQQLSAYNALKSATRFVLEIDRNGAKFTLAYVLTET